MAALIGTYASDAAPQTQRIIPGRHPLMPGVIWAPLMRACQPIEQDHGFLDRTLKRNDRTGYAAIVREAHQQGADAYLFGDALEAALDGTPQAYRTVELLVVTPEGRDGWWYDRLGDTGSERVMLGDVAFSKDMERYRPRHIEAEPSYGLVHGGGRRESSVFSLAIFYQREFEGERRKGLERHLDQIARKG